MVAYDRFPTNRRTANQLSPNVEERAGNRAGVGRKTRWQPIQWEKPYPKSFILASGDYSKAFLPVFAEEHHEPPPRCAAVQSLCLVLAPPSRWSPPRAPGPRESRARTSRNGSPISPLTSSKGARFTRPASAWPPPTSRITCRRGARSRPATTAPICRPCACSASSRPAIRRVTVTVGGETRTFTDGDGDHVSEERRRQAHADGRTAWSSPATASTRRARGHMDFRGKDVKGAAVVWLGPQGPKGLDAHSIAASWPDAAATRPKRSARSPSIGRGGPDRWSRDGGRRRRGARRRSRPPEAAAAARRCRPPTSPPSSVSTRRSPPSRHRRPTRSSSSSSASAPAKYDELKRKAAAQEALPSFRLDDVTLTFNVDADYEIVRTQLAQNVVGDRRGIDPQLKNTLRRVRRALRSRRLRGRRSRRSRQTACAAPARQDA